ncbi:MAG: phospholipid scramblase-related protein, partial [Aeoliella sp.]
TGWEFRFMAGSTELALVTKKWSGMGKELFTSADNYVLKISDSIPADHPTRLLILAAVMCIDMVLKE